MLQTEALEPNVAPNSKIFLMLCRTSLSRNACLCLSHRALSAGAMIYDVACFYWWKFVIPLTNGKPAIRYYEHLAGDWWVVRDPDQIPHVYWQEREQCIQRDSPPPIDQDIGVQTMGASWEQTLSDVVLDTRVQTQYDVWDQLREMVSCLSIDEQHTVYSRLIRYLDLGLLYPRHH